MLQTCCVFSMFALFLCITQFYMRTLVLFFTSAAGLYIKSSETLNISANAVHANHDNGIAVYQSSQFTHITNNSITCNSVGGVLVEAGCKVELRGNGIYDNNSHGVTSKGEGSVLENDILGNHGYGLQLLENADMKVRAPLYFKLSLLLH